MIGLAAPCVANVLQWLMLFTRPRLGFREDNITLFATVWLLGVGCALAGIVAVLASAKSRVAWSFLAFFSIVVLLNVYGFLWSIGNVASAFS